MKINKTQRLLLLVAIIAGGGVGIYFIGAYVGLWAGAPDVTPTEDLTTFTLIDYVTGEDVSAWVEVSVWTPDETDLPFGDEDPYLITNFDEDVESQDADDVSIDLSDHAVAWLEIDPDFESDYGGYNGVYNALATRDMRRLIGSSNYDYNIYVYHAPSNVSVAVLERGAMIAGSNLGDASRYNNTFVNPVAGSAFNRGTCGNYTVYLNMPLFSNDAWHAGTTGNDAWEIDAEELADMTDSEMEWLRDQSNFRTITPYYDLTDDINLEFGDNLETVTNCFAVKFGLNTTISTTDGETTQVNLTVSERDYNNLPIEVIVEGTFIWLVFYSPVNCYDGNYNFDIDLSFAADIYLGNVTTVRVETPDDDDNLGTATVLNTAELIHYLQHGGVA